MWRRVVIALLVAAVFLRLHLLRMADPVLDPANASAVFDEARELSERDGGSLWGMNLYGPMLLVDKDSRKVIANGMDADSSLRRSNDVFVGAWPEDMAVANTAIEWGGKKWTMVMWPLPASRYDRNALIAHEPLRPDAPGR